MEYPINVEARIAAMEAIYGADENAAEVYRVYTKFVNDAYSAGLNGKQIKNLLDYAAAFEKEVGPMGDVCWKIISGFDRWAREAYNQGQRDAGKRAIEPENADRKQIPRV